MQPRWPSFLLTLVTIVWLGVVVGSSTPASASHNLLANGDFDAGIDGWTLDSATGTQLTWDSTTGNPLPGSLRLSGSGTGFLRGHALSECFAPPLGTVFRVEANVLAISPDGGAFCIPYVSTYQSSDCTGFRTFLGSGPGFDSNANGVWETRASSQEITALRPSFRVSLFFDYGTIEQSSATCYFDSVELFIPGTESVVEVPTTSGPGLWLLIAGLGASAVWALRRVA